MSPDYDPAARDRLYDPPEGVEPPACPECGCENTEWVEADRADCRCYFFARDGICRAELPGYMGDESIDQVNDGQTVLGWRRCGGRAHVCASRGCCEEPGE